jgi:hypothetical protein
MFSFGVVTTSCARTLAEKSSSPSFQFLDIQSRLSFAVGNILKPSWRRRHSLIVRDSALETAFAISWLGVEVTLVIFRTFASMISRVAHLRICDFSASVISEGDWTAFAYSSLVGANVSISTALTACFGLMPKVLGIPLHGNFGNSDSNYFRLSSMLGAWTT